MIATTIIFHWLSKFAAVEQVPHISELEQLIECRPNYVMFVETAEQVTEARLLALGHDEKRWFGQTFGLCLCAPPEILLLLFYLGVFSLWDFFHFMRSEQSILLWNYHNVVLIALVEAIEIVIVLIYFNFMHKSNYFIFFASKAPTARIPLLKPTLKKEMLHGTHFI